MAKGVWIQSILLGTVLLSACAHEYRVYDPYRNDYHHWDDREDVYYNRWAHESHHEGRHYKKLNRDEQREYWNWRHNHPDR